jgi:hypothetical protein
MKPYTLIIIPRWFYDKHRPAIETTANWKTYWRGSSEFMVCCVLTLEISKVGGGYNREQLLDYTCGDCDNVIIWHPTEDYDGALAHSFYMLAETTGVSPE